MSKLIFANIRLFQHVSFVFEVGEDIALDSRGNYKVSTKQVEVKFQLKPISNDFDRRREKNVLEETYKAKVISHDGVLPDEIVIGDVGTGKILGRYCEAEIISIAQSTVLPITQKIIGQKVRLLIRYRSR